MLKKIAVNLPAVIWLIAWYVVSVVLVVTTLSSVQIKQELINDPDGLAAHVLASVGSRSAELATAAVVQRADQLALGYPGGGTA